MRGFVSRYALNKVFEESKQEDWIGHDIYAFGCVIRHTNELPCSQEINEYKLEGRNILLSCVDPRWRKLDLVKSTKYATKQISCST